MAALADARLCTQDWTTKELKPVESAGENEIAISFVADDALLPPSDKVEKLHEELSSANKKYLDEYFMRREVEKKLKELADLQSAAL